MGGEGGRVLGKGVTFEQSSSGLICAWESDSGLSFRLKVCLLGTLHQMTRTAVLSWLSEEFLYIFHTL